MGVNYYEVGSLYVLYRGNILNHNENFNGSILSIKLNAREELTQLTLDDQTIEIGIILIKYIIPVGMLNLI